MSSWCGPTRRYPHRASFGVGLAFFMIAVGQAIGAPLVGLLADGAGIAATFYGCAAAALAGSLLTLGRGHPPVP
ncbi:MAG TPA: hypothetical protein VFR88_01470 [Microlunatus sp.]|nr:hypothetical protein [Microlunatus sp.]